MGKEKVAYVALGVFLDRAIFKPTGKVFWFGMGFLSSTIVLKLVPVITEVLKNVKV